MKRPAAVRCSRGVIQGARGWTLRVVITVGLIGAGMMFICGGDAAAATPGLPFTEDFAADNLKDPGTTATWSTAQQQVYLAWSLSHQNVFGADTTGTDITADAQNTQAIAIGDVDGDGNMDVVAGNNGQVKPPIPEQRHRGPLQLGDRNRHHRRCLRDLRHRAWGRGRRR